MSSPSCLVNEYNYEIGCLFPAIAIIIAISFMKKRVRLRPDLFNGRPALPVPVDFLSRDKNRFTIAIAFGATSVSCFNMFRGSSAAFLTFPKTPWAEVFRGVLMTICYGIINYPYFACLNAEYKMIGYTIGLIYSFVRLVVELFVVFGCNTALTSVMYGDIFIVIPGILCKFFLVGSYALLLYRALKELSGNDHVTLRDILRSEEAQDFVLAGKEEKIHVMLLLANKLNEKRVAIAYEPWYTAVWHRIYESRPDFKFSTQFLSAVLVSCLFLYQLMVAIVVISISVKHILKQNVLYDYVIAASVLGTIISVLQLCCFIRSHRADVFKTYKSRKGLEGEILKPKMIVGKYLRFCGYQIGFTGIGLLFNWISMLFLLLPIWLCELIYITSGSEQLLYIIKKIVLISLPLVVTMFLTWISLVLLCLFVFRDNTYPDITVNVDNRRLYGVMTYFYFYFYILVGVFSGMIRLVKGAVLGLVFLPRLDRTSMMKGYRRYDRGYMAYIGFLHVLVAFKHPVMLCFCQLLLDERRRKVNAHISSNEMPRSSSSKAVNRWLLAYMLMRNPSLQQHRKQGRNSSFSHPRTLSGVMVNVPGNTDKV